jgi:hypothetical protein
MKRLRALLPSILFVVAATPAGAQWWGQGFQPTPARQSDPNANYILLGPYTYGGEGEPIDNYRLINPISPLTKTDHGPTGNLDINLTTVPLNLGGTNATTQQGAVNSILGFPSLAAGDITYYNGTNWVRLPIGTGGQILTVSGGGLPVWSASSAPAPADTTILTVTDESGDLPDSRQLTVTADLVLTDNGAGSTLELGVNSSVVLLTGAQSITGQKTLTLPRFAYDSGNGVVLMGSTNNSSLKWADWPAARNITIPDPGADANFVLTESAQTVNGVKTFGSAPKLSTNTITTSGNNTITLPNATRTVATLDGTEDLENKTLLSPIINTSIVWDLGANDITIEAATPAGAQILTIPDSGGNAEIVTTTATQTLTNKQLSVGQLTGTLDPSQGGTGTTGIPAKGTILVGNNAGTAYQTLAVGTNGHVLTADSTVAGGVKWAAAGGGGGGSVDSVTLAPDAEAGNLIGITDIGTSTDPSFEISLTNPDSGSIKFVWGHRSGLDAAPNYLNVDEIIDDNIATHDELVFFGGNGTDGAKSSITGASFHGQQFNFSGINISSGASADGMHACTILVSGDAQITNSVGFTADGAGNRGGQGRSAASAVGMGGGRTCPVAGANSSQLIVPSAPHDGWGGNTSAAASGGGGGGSAVATGGAGGAGTSVNSGWPGAPPAYSPGFGSAVVGTKVGGGGGAGASMASGTSSDGGHGGGYIILAARGDINFDGTTEMSARGTAGGNGGGTNGGGSGGGGGGTIWLFSQDDIDAGGVNVSGGNGGNSVGTSMSGGGGGAGGFVYGHAPTFSSFAPTVSGGTGGSGSGGGPSGQNGGNGDDMQITGTPSCVSVAFAVDAKAVIAECHLLNAVAWIHGKEGKHHKLSNLRQSQWLAAWYAKPGNFDELCYAINYGGDIDKSLALSEVEVKPVMADEIFNIQMERSAECDLVELEPAA